MQPRDGQRQIEEVLGRFEEIVVTRPCEAIEVPTGFHITIPAGAHARVMQTLGGAYTVVVDDQYMARIAPEDADALGKPVPPSASEAAGLGPDAPIEDQVVAELKSCYDPEIPVNIVDLGLIYDCRIDDLADGGYAIEVEMTLTAPGCGMGDILKADIERKLGRLAGVKRVHVELVLDPPWDMSRMSDAAKLELGLL